MSVKKAEELFLHELGGILDAEQRIVQMLPMMAKETENSEIQKAYQQHESETRQQIRNIEQCFQIMGEQPKTCSCMVVDGMRKEHDQFLKEQPSPMILTMFDLSGTAKTEHYEIASYQGLVEQANMMGQKQCAQLLQQNLQQEQAMAEKVALFARELGPQVVSMS
jgi:ferritin-like metal-binding protein YciE